MQAGKKTLGMVFADYRQNVIPLYQRPYVWAQERNWEPLWEDIRLAAEESELDAHQAHESRTYFLGAIVLQDRKTGPLQVSSQFVVDGQQRLTTLQVLIASAHEVASSVGADSIAAGLRHLIYNSKDIVSPDYPDDRYKV